MINYFHFGLRYFVILSGLAALSSCGLTTARPKLEMSLAAEALIAAKYTKSDQIVPAIYRKAEFYYLKAKSSYRRKYFNKAQQYAILSKKFSEKAEYEAIRKSAIEGSTAAD